MDDALKGYEDHIFRGNPQWKAVPIIDEDGDTEGYNVFFMDVEYDPIRVNVDCDGTATLPAHDDLHRYAMMTPEMMIRLGNICKRIKAKHARQ